MSAFDANEMFECVARQAAMGERRAGSAAGKANEDYIFSELTRFGVPEVRREEVPVTSWKCENATLSVGRKEIPVFGIPFTRFTSPEGLEAPLIYAEPNSWFAPRKWKGKIVVAEVGFPRIDKGLLERLALGKYDPHGDLFRDDRVATWIRLGWHLYRWAVARGAVGFIGILKDQPGGSREMYAPYGFKERDILDKPVPGLWVSRRDGRDLTALARAGASACMKLVGTTESVMSHNIVGEIPGQTAEAIVLSTHHDSPFVSPVEDASGVAVVLALAKHLAKGPVLRRRTVVLFTSGHFYGSIGTRSFIDRHRKGLVSQTALEISVEHIALEAKENGEGHLVATGRPEPTGIFVPFNRSVRDLVLKGLSTHGLDRTVLLPPEGPLGKYPPTDGGDWYEAGVPVINSISNPVYLLTNDDALNWVDKDRLPAAAGFFTDLLRELDEVPTATLRQVDFQLRKGLMKVLAPILWAKTTWLGWKPLH